MDLNFALVVFCLTLITIIALVLGRERVAEQAVKGLSETAGGLIRSLRQAMERISEH